MLREEGKKKKEEDDALQAGSTGSILCALGEKKKRKKGFPWLFLYRSQREKNQSPAATRTSHPLRTKKEGRIKLPMPSRAGKEKKAYCYSPGWTTSPS